MSRRISILLIVLTLLLAACQPVATPQAAGPQTYTLGIALPYTGDLGSFGTDFKKGVELAVEQMNSSLSAAGSNVQFATASADTEGSPDGAAKAVQTIVQTSGAKVIVGPLTTGEVLGAKQFADENQVVIVAPASSAPSASIPGDYIFRVMYPPDTNAAKAFAQIATAREYKNLVVLQVDDPFGNGLVESFSANFKTDGEVSVTKYAKDVADLSGEASKISAEITRLSAAGKTAFFCVCFLGEAQKLLQLAATDEAMGSVEWLGVENLVNKDLLTDATQAAFLTKVKLTSVSFADRANPNTQVFKDAFQAKFGSEPGPFTNYAYDAANIAMLSMLAAGNSGAGVQSILPTISNHYIGTSVQAHLDANGDQDVVFYGIFEINADGTDFTQIGTFDGATGEVSFD